MNGAIKQKEIVKGGEKAKEEAAEKRRKIIRRRRRRKRTRKRRKSRRMRKRRRSLWKSTRIISKADCARIEQNYQGFCLVCIGNSGIRYLFVNVQLCL